MTLSRTEDWTLQAKCRGMQDKLFPEGVDQACAPGLHGLPCPVTVSGRGAGQPHRVGCVGRHD